MKGRAAGKVCSSIARFARATWKVAVMAEANSRPSARRTAASGSSIFAPVASEGGR